MYTSVTVAGLAEMDVTSKRAIYARVSVVALGIAAASLLHFLTPPSLILWHNLFQRLYYLPIVYSAIYFGWRGGLAASLLSAILYIPHILMAWHHMPDYAMNQYAEIILFFLVGAVTGALADRERKQREKLEAATQQLSKVYRELQDSFEQLKRADRLSAIGHLSASLAHEIRNPLASIEGSTDILDQPHITDEMRQEFLGVIRKESRRLNRLLTNLLDFARPKKPELQLVDLARLIESVTSLVAPTAERSGITLERSVPSLPPLVQCDPEQLKQVVLNLTINAIQAMAGGGKIELSVTALDGNVRISVRDEGPGIPAQDLEKIFDPFFTTKENGTGLGLSVAHQIITQHGGAITAEPNPDRGMTFSIALPARGYNS
jgi:two-component system, NtrC family, sensor histidine kinase HydH